jgi:hypothetical protein
LPSLVIATASFVLIVLYNDALNTQVVAWHRILKRLDPLFGWKTGLLYHAAVEFGVPSVSYLSFGGLVFFVIMIVSCYALIRSCFSTVTFATVVVSVYAVSTYILLPAFRNVYVSNFQIHFLSWFTNTDLLLASLPLVVILTVGRVSMWGRKLGRTRHSIWR